MYCLNYIVHGLASNIDLEDLLLKPFFIFYNFLSWPTKRSWQTVGSRTVVTSARANSSRAVPGIMIGSSDCLFSQVNGDPLSGSCTIKVWMVVNYGPGISPL